MKKNVFLMLFFTAIVAIGFSSCKDDDDNNGAVWCTDCAKADVIGNYMGSGEYKIFRVNGTTVTEADSIYLIVTDEGTSEVSISIGQKNMYTNTFSGIYDGGYSLNFLKTNFSNDIRMTSSIYKNNGKIQINGSVSEIEKTDTSYLAKKTLIFEVVKTTEDDE